MHDAAFNLILKALDDTGNPLLVADENLPLEFIHQIPESVAILTNRFDLFQTMSPGREKVTCNDFDFSALADASMDQIYYRTSKEKAVVHHVINEAGRVLKLGGKFFLAGHKQEGIQTYIKKAEKLFGAQASVIKDGPARIGIIEKKSTGEKLDDQDYGNLRLAIQDEVNIFYSKPGVFGWNKIDQGSAYLIQHLDVLNHTESTRVLDLGCGYGYLAIKAMQLNPSLIDATDNNATAALACKKNYEQYKIHGHVYLDECGDSLLNHYDVIICNPPFHQGFDTERSLTEKFIRASRRLLSPQGQALFVVNSFIPLEKIAASYFRSIEVVANNKQFKLILLAAPII